MPAPFTTWCKGNGRQALPASPDTSGRDVRLFSRNGKDFTDRFPLIPAAVLRLPVRSAAIDGELVACDGEDKPDFYALMRRPASGLCVWCFDLLVLNGRDLRSLPLERRKAKLSALLAKNSVTATSYCMRRRRTASRASSANVVNPSTSPVRHRGGSRSRRRSGEKPTVSGTSCSRRPDAPHMITKQQRKACYSSRRSSSARVASPLRCARLPITSITAVRRWRADY